MQIIEAMAQPATGRIRILLVDDHAVFRQSVARVLAAEAAFDVLDCPGIREALQIVEETPIDIVLLDFDLGNERASQFLPTAAEAGFRGRVLIVTAWISDSEARRLIGQGAAGIFLKEHSLVSLVEGIRAVAAGQPWLGERHFPQIQNMQESEDAGSGPRFNERQRKVLRFVVEGLSNKEIGWRLQISETYVKRILQILFQKTGVRTRGQLVRVALEQYEDQL